MLALPVWLCQLWRFITPGLNPKEKRTRSRSSPRRSSCSRCGAVVAFLTLEPALKFLLNIGGADLQPLLTADKYLSLVSLMIVAFGLSFEFPVVLVFLLIAGCSPPSSCATGGAAAIVDRGLRGASSPRARTRTRCSSWPSPCTCSTRRRSSSVGS